MNIEYKWGFYVGGHLINVEAGLNVSKDYYKNLKRVLKIEKMQDYYMTRVGNSNRDGGYIMANDFVCPSQAYSFGISNDVSWDLDMASKGYKIFMYDHTINGLPIDNQNFNFFKEGLGGKHSKNGPLDTLENYIIRNKHTNNKNMILKIDVEGAEWDFLETVKPEILQQFDQILFEFHNLVRACSEDEQQRKINALEKLNKTHQLIHLHGNNCGYQLTIGGALIPDVIEVTYVNKSKYKTVEDTELDLPNHLDYPNDLGRKDIMLGNWNTTLIS